MRNCNIYVCAFDFCLNFYLTVFCFITGLKSYWVHRGRGGVRVTSFRHPSHILHTFSSEPHQNAPPYFSFLNVPRSVVQKHFSKIRPS